MIIKKDETAYTLHVAGRDYTITSADSPEHVRRLAVYVDRKIAETASSGLMNRESSAVIACLSVAEELMSAQDDNTRMRRELMLAKQELQALRRTKEQTE